MSFGLCQPNPAHRMKILSSLLLALYIIIEYSDLEMKKVKVNIAPSLGIKEEFYVDIRFDRDEFDTLLDCIQANCQNIHNKIMSTYPDGISGSWRINSRILNMVYDHYYNEPQ